MRASFLLKLRQLGPLKLFPQFLRNWWSECCALVMWGMLIGTLGMGTTSRAGEWPEFRGPTGQGHADHEQIPLTWSASQNVTWKQPIPGLAWSSPVIHAGRIYLTTAIDATPAGADRKDNLTIELGAICLDEKTGKTLWQKKLFTQQGDVEFHNKNSHASPTPIVHQEALYVHYGPHGTARLTLAGEVVWTQTLPYLPTHGNGGSPALAGEVLVICCDGHDEQYAVGLETSTGRIRWKTDREIESRRGFSFGTPLVIEVNGQPQAICPASDAVYAYAPATGEEIWRVQYPNGYSVTPRPVYGNGLLYVCTGFERPSLFAIDPTGRGDLTETHVRWRTNKNVPHSASPLLVDKNLFFVADKGIARCVDALTGEDHWQERLGGNYSASPLYANGRVYFQDENGECIVVAASSTYQELARNQLVEDERTFASYAVSDGALFIRSEHHLFRIEDEKTAAIPASSKSIISMSTIK